ncbi:DCC family protein At1g52590, chloroplastic-like [Papaver somniferum]|uniref:DCC family protein At1g52590, chloroplastic-like n=1 Tax=Papaver somniferum TaxID=3469 RepID=UPI000E701F2C|nr:DCC family protein At1g52590, chloroplastic-like [Papaver somniferum]
MRSGYYMDIVNRVCTKSDLKIMRLCDGISQLTFEVRGSQVNDGHFEFLRPIMLFDGVCNLCNGGVKFIRRMRFEPLQSESGKKLLQRSKRAPDDISSVVLVEKDRSYIKSEAVLKIMEYLNLPFPQLALFLQFVPLFIRDFVYDNVADNRYNIFGRTESCEI